MTPDRAAKRFRYQLWGLIAIWLCFLVRALFYCSVLPLWEGYDEYSHFAFVHHLAAHGQLPDPAHTRISREIERSMQLAPVPWDLRGLPPAYLTHEEYWELPAAERLARQRELLALPPALGYDAASDGLLLYEGQQPPLYYWLFSVPLRMVASSPLPSRVLLLRVLSVLLSSLVVPLSFVVGRRVFRDARIALNLAILVALIPEFLLDVSRVGNESLAVVLYSVLLYLGIRLVDNPQDIRCACLFGLSLGCGLLTKAYFLTALPATLLVFAVLAIRGPDRRMKTCQGAACALGLALLLAGWWYWQARQSTGSWSGQVDAAAASFLPPLRLVAAAREVEWLKAFDFVLMTHVWCGGWSFLQLRSWMYHVLFFLGFVGIAGLLPWGLRRWAATAGQATPSARHLLVLLAFYGWLWIGVAYHVLAVFVRFHWSASVGWYLYCAVLAEIILVVTGWSALLPDACRPWLFPTIAGMMVALELYATHFLLLPYYSGMIAHLPNGHLSAFHPSHAWRSGLAAILERLTANKAVGLNSTTLSLEWILFLVATAGLAAGAIWLAVLSGRQQRTQGC
jgi:hypothetical protein